MVLCRCECMLCMDVCYTLCMHVCMLCVHIDRCMYANEHMAYRNGKKTASTGTQAEIEKAESTILMISLIMQ